MLLKKLSMLLLALVSATVITSCAIFNQGKTVGKIVDFDPLPSPTSQSQNIPDNKVEFKIISHTQSEPLNEKITTTIGEGAVVTYLYVSDPLVPDITGKDSVTFEIIAVRSNIKDPSNNLVEAFNQLTKLRPHITKADLFSIAKINVDKDGKIGPNLWSVEFE
jgi:hypothetical protein